jgi:ArsR family transcriptional regulator, arsenate/arsenite/antimonite-responsive transcriptional repressor
MLPEITDEQLASFFHLFADRHRLHILRMLSKGQEMSVTQLGNELNQTQPAVSHHLSMLKDAGIIDYRRDGRFNRYHMAKDGLSQAIEKFVGSMSSDETAKAINLAGLEIRINRLN